MPPIGETLREARLRQRIDIAQVEQATKIRAKYLRALESEEFDRLPGATFVRTFLRTYAEYLGLDSQALVEEYRTRHEVPEEDELQPFAPQPSSPPLGGEGRRRRPQVAAGRGQMVAAAVVGLIALLLVIGLLGGGDDDEDDGRRASAQDARQDRDRKRGGGGERTETETEPVPDEVELEVAPAFETYVCVENGAGEQLINATITEPETFEAEVLRVNLGNTQVQIEQNGEQVPIEEGPNPAGFEFTPDGMEELPEGERPCL